GEDGGGDAPLNNSVVAPSGKKSLVGRGRGCDNGRHPTDRRNGAMICVLCLFAASAAPPPPRGPVPDRLVVLTFDDASKSHFTVARPLLKKYGFGATFFVTEGFDFATNKRDYMTWEEIAALHKDGFEIGNHTRDHKGVTDRTLKELPEQVRALAA